MPAAKQESPSATPDREEEPAQDSSKQASDLTEEVWTGLQSVLTYVYDYRTDDGHDPSKIFQRMVNKRVLPGYYDVISEPIALSTIKHKLSTKEYLTIKDSVRDFALIPHNAFVYNLPDSGAYQDAVVIKQILEEQLKKLVDTKVISDDDAQLPYLGEIPAADEQPADEDDEDEDEEDDEDDAEEEEVEVPKKRGRGRPRKSSVIKRDAAAAASASAAGAKVEKDESEDEKADDGDDRKRRGRPPKVLTPTEHRIQTVLKGIRKPKNDDGQAMIVNFERLPDKAALPDYFVEIKEPMAYDILKRKYKRKKYPTLDHFMLDVNLMFENAKQYNQDESEIYQDAVKLQAEAQRLAEEVKARPDTEFVGDEGRIPMPEGILHNGELYKAGDWVLVQNANDLTKPIPSQIYRTYQDAQGGKMVNVCWYYRPEQTVHRFDKHFYEGEVMKTGQYRDHRIDEIVGRCFIMFITRYFKGRPANLPADTDVFVCDARFNEEKCTFNKIKTWASCLPDEVRDKDYAVEQFPTPRRMKKYPSPIAYLLKDDQKETDDLPKPEWGADNAPPKIGAVHRRPRNPKESPPPEPTPPPPPTPPPAPVQRAPDPPARASYTAGSPAVPQSADQQSPGRPGGMQRSSYSGILPQQYQQQTGSPNTAMQNRAFQQQYPPGTPSALTTLQQQQQLRPSQPQQAQPPIQPGVIPTNPYLRADAASYRGPPPIEVYTLPDAANYSIPVEIRNLFQCDDADRVLFFTAPPGYPEDEELKTLNLAKGSSTTDDSSAGIGHSARYLAAKSRRAEELASKRADYQREKEAQRDLDRKRKRDEEQAIENEIDKLKRRALRKLQAELGGGTKRAMQALYGSDWREEAARTVDELEQVKALAEEREREIEREKRERTGSEKITFDAFRGTLDAA